MTPLRFRTHGETEWHIGSTVNFSHSGVLFRANEPLPGVGFAVDFVVTLPINGVTPQPQVRCTGRVVRVVECDMAGSSHAVAVEIHAYAFEGWHRT